MKKIISVILLVLIVATAAVSLCACGNKNWWDLNFTFKYIVINEGGHSVLHEIESWTDDESESVTLRTKCCGNYIWTSANNATLYEKKPGSYAYDTTCAK